MRYLKNLHPSGDDIIISKLKFGEFTLDETSEHPAGTIFQDKVKT